MVSHSRAKASLDAMIGVGALVALVVVGGGGYLYLAAKKAKNAEPEAVAQKDASSTEKTKNDAGPPSEAPLNRKEKLEPATIPETKSTTPVKARAPVPKAVKVKAQTKTRRAVFTDNLTAMDWRHFKEGAVAQYKGRYTWEQLAKLLSKDGGLAKIKQGQFEASADYSGHIWPMLQKFKLEGKTGTAAMRSIATAVNIGRSKSPRKHREEVIRFLNKELVKPYVDPELP